MAKYVALLRGINVGGRNKVAMPRLREVMQSLGFTDVVTHLQSGNVVFSIAGGKRRSTAALTRAVEAGLQEELGIGVRVLVLIHGEIADVVTGNPLPDAVAEPSKFHVAFLSSNPAPTKIAGLDPAAYQNEEIRLADRAVYVWFRAGVHGSKFTLDVIERRLGVTATMRNWNTVTKLLELSGG